ncbi:PepSY-associated TM helix domain-containing protein [Pseudopedobacter saltans DSM 12145]|uniref:PepSY-associated TM helix domain-containing protein n=1 Tax=Pseudopedobacter saltans (strain ATCC 51119 / DSM 12145 / JCM 21818 / CCUG 39354 / LMG 10337 / NBRC 100064 / NCIMB 13643) TaxID=762903 RepID=F0SDR9_PSESL|nr:PepSY-associated TM helix domain-containing protein [Pseudopedobacter saltans]ADY51815.1 PepSY-associated TM helix domain-containing protein [Pseudopedobacter saltans DSM 12145]
MRNFFLSVHKYLGIVTGIIIFIEALTGCIYCFQDEIKDYLHSDYRKVSIQNSSFISPSQVYPIVKSALPNANVNRMMYMGKDRSIVAMATDLKKTTFFVYINPYNGKVLKTEKMLDDIFYIILYIHICLLIPGKTGKLIIGISAIIFMVLLIIGLILWWPKNGKFKKRYFTIKWGAKIKRVNFDLHNVLGFYISGLAFIMILTGLSFAFEPVKNGIYKTLNLGKSKNEEITRFQFIPEKVDSLNLLTDLDKAYAYARVNSKNADMLWLYLPNEAKSPLAIRAYHESLRYAKVDEYQFDFNEHKTHSLLHEDLSTGKKANNMNYDLHTGQQFGIIGKIIFFIGSFIIGSLPITGFILWRSKVRKLRKKKQKKLTQIV